MSSRSSWRCDRRTSARYTGARMAGTAHADTLVGSMLGKDYRVLDQIGVGGMAVVYLVEHQTLMKEFAAKVLSREHTSSSEARARFTQEAHAASQLDHENIVGSRTSASRPISVRTSSWSSCAARRSPIGSTKVR